MDFLGIGPWEILLILILALILVGPGKITEVAKTMGRTIRAIKKASSDLTATVTRELEEKENKPPSPQPKETKTLEAPLATSQPAMSSQVDQPTKPGEASATK